MSKDQIYKAKILFMYKDKSFLTTYGPINTNLNNIYLKSRSLSSKSFGQQRIGKSYEKRFIEKTYDKYPFQPTLQEINFTHYPSQRKFMDQNLRSHSQYYEILSQHKKSPNQDFANLSRQKSNLSRSKSVNQVYRFHRIEMLHKINNYLEDHLNKKTHQAQMNQKRQKQQFQSQIIAKLDKLEKYLQKIKSQRQKQHKPKPQQNVLIQANNKKQSQQNITLKQIPLPLDKTHKNQYLQALSQLDKIKKQLHKVRSQALSVRERNSLSRNKHQNPQNSQKPHIISLKPLNQNKLLQKQLKSHYITPSYNAPKQLQIQQANNGKTQTIRHNFPYNQDPKEIRKNNHMHQNYSSFNNFESLSKPFLNLTNNNHISSSKPKITFSFANKV